MSTIHHKWLAPMPSYWNDFYERDAEILDTPILTKRELQGSEKECAFCGQVFEPMGHNGNLRIRCYDPECEKARKRHNSRISARRVKARKRAQQA